MTYVAIMAGGIGSRFWPASRSARPKQFLDILGVGRSLLQLTFDRFKKLTSADRIFIVTNAQYRDLVLEQLPELTPEQVLCEPSRNNTGPCVAYTAFRLHSLDPEANFVVAPSDHIILKEAEFLEALRKALAFTEAHEALCTLGIQPTRPDTGYGYIRYERNETEPGIHAVEQFTEKPPLDQARSFLEQGNYLWNAGIFIWRSAVILELFRELAPDIYRILQAGEGQYNTPGEQAFIDEHYPKTPSISVDYAILEKASKVYTIPADIAWSDLGTWNSLHAESDKDEQSNVRKGRSTFLPDSSGCLLRSPEGKLVVVKGLQDYIVVDEGDVLLVWPRGKEQEIKAFTEQLAKGDFSEYL